MTNRQLSAYIAEAVGTFILATVAMNAVGGFGPIIVGLALMVLVAVFGGISGAHLNPAVTVGLFANGKVKINDFIAYIIAQLAGGALAWKFAEYLTDSEVTRISRDFDAKLLIVEVLGMAVFAMGIASVVFNKIKGIQAAATVGFSLMLGVMVTAAVGGAVLNPAVALATQALSIESIVGPLLGSVLGMGMYSWLNKYSDS